MTKTNDSKVATKSPVLYLGFSILISTAICSVLIGLGFALSAYVVMPQVASGTLDAIWSNLGVFASGVMGAFYGVPIGVVIGASIGAIGLYRRKEK